MRIVFAGTPDFAASHLQALIDSEFDIVAVYTQPDRPAGRGKKLQVSDVKALAQNHGIPVCQPLNFKSEESISELKAWTADIMVVVAYGLLLPKNVLDTPTYGCVNVHGSILPAWRGAAPIQRAVWAGDKETGVTIMQMDEGLDTGDIIEVKKLPIESEDTSASIYKKLAEIGPKTLLNCLRNWENKTTTTQTENQATYAKKLSKQEAQIDWSNTAEELERYCRAFNPWPVLWFETQNTAVKVWDCTVITSSTEHSYVPGQVVSADKQGITVQCGQDMLQLKEIQIPGKQRKLASDIINAKRDWFSPGVVL